MSPGHKRQAAERFVAEGRCSQRRACRYFRLHRSTYRYRAKEPDAWMARLRSAVRRVSGKHSAWGYAKVAKLLRDEGSPWQNGFIESFHSRFREECLDREQLWTLSEARVVIEDWWLEYNALRPHKSLRLETLLDFASLNVRYSKPKPERLRLSLPVGQFG